MDRPGYGSMVCPVGVLSHGLISVNSSLRTLLLRSDDQWLKPLWENSSKVRRKAYGPTSTDLLKFSLMLRELEKGFSDRYLKMAFWGPSLQVEDKKEEGENHSRVVEHGWFLHDTRREIEHMLW